MKKLVIVLAGVTIFLINVAYGTECVHTHDTSNVSHQFYDALIETPKDAIVKGAIATKDLGKEVASTVVSSDAAHNLKEAAKELVIEAPVKTAYAIKNGTVKAYDATKEGAKVVYNVAVRKPAHAIKNAAVDVAHSDFVQGTKEAVVELGEQFAEAGHDVVDATKYGAHKVYHVVIEKPVGAVKAAAHYLAHGDEKEAAEVAIADHDVCVMVLQTPLIAHRSLDYSNAHEQLKVGFADNITTVSVMPSVLTNATAQVVSSDNRIIAEQQVGVEFLVDSPCLLTDDNYALSASTLKHVEKAYNAIKADLARHK